MTSSSEPNRVAFVTGAARGIGAAAVRALCNRGYHVVAVDSCASDSSDRPTGVSYPLGNRHDLEALEAEFPNRVLTRIVDVRDVEAVASAASFTVDRFGRLDAAVAAAGIIIGGKPLWETPASHVESLWNVDVMGVWNTAASCIPHMLRGPDPSGCRFVAVASVAAERGLFHLAGYVAAKHAVVGIIRGLAADLVGTGVTAAAVSPGSTRTPMLQASADLYGLGDVEDFAGHQLVRRLIDPAEIAEAIAFCCSLEGMVVNGSNVSADGGLAS
jgi:SDR family mycofactocin-dependent oxidoreductase